MEKNKFNVGDRIEIILDSCFGQFYKMGDFERITGTIKKCEWNILHKEYGYHVLFDDVIRSRKTNDSLCEIMYVFENEMNLLSECKSKNEEYNEEPWGNMTDEEIGRMADKKDVINYFGFYQSIVAEAIGLAYKKGYMRARKNRPFKLGEKHEN